MPSNEATFNILRRKIPFTVDNTVNQIIVGGGAGLFNVWDPSFATQYYFRPGENIILESMQIILPYCFEFGNGGGGVGFGLENGSGVPGPFPVFNLGELLLSANKQIIEIGTYIPWSSFSTAMNDEKFMITLASSLFTISMVGVPDSLNGLNLDAELQLITKSTEGVIP